ncbi:MAG: acyl-ACP thioesterase [Fibrobacter sp.]|jgi:acyl-ACP thioesterase|nr:acyl-ACP thioesterase [Fibrobacter sp.]
MDTGITTKHFSVRFSDCDHTSHLRFSGLMRFMEESAILDVEKNGVGIWKLMQHGYTYALSRMKIRISQFPVWGEKLSVSTWTKGYYQEKVALKDYAITDAQGNTIALATSSWLLVNLKTGKSENPENAPFVPPLFPEQDAMSEMLKLFEPPAGGRVVQTRQAAASDLDMNRHVNHCRYADWTMDSFTMPELKEKQFRSLQINFLSQILHGETVNLVRFPDTNHHTMIFGVSETDPSKTYFQARIGFA